jgi:2-polyprenyl-3-methyl-5-hydroxy-6-metoxy-1,4-benzoquinol methylase
MVECKNCGFIYANPRPDWETLKELYQTYHSRNSKGMKSWAELMDRIFKETACFISNQFPYSGKLLDIGCGYGHFIDIMESYGWDAYGLEPSSAVSCARTKLLKVAHGTLDDVRYNPNSFDVITMFYVLEHLIDPVGVLLKVNNILKPGGILILRAPHSTPIVRLLSILGIENNLYDLPFHLSDFSPETIRRILEKTGFKAIRTFPGEFTRPNNFLERSIATFTGEVAKILYWLSLRRFLLPGVSKTTIAEKPPYTHKK